MRNIICVIGEPGVGKTTLFRNFMNFYSWIDKEPVKLVNTKYCEELDLHIIGKYEDGEVFAGTDRLSMAVMPEAMKFVEGTSSNVMFEGDRLTSTKFFDFLMDLPETNVSIIVLTVPQDILNERYEQRGSDQSEKFLKGRKTKINNIRGNFDYMDNIEVFENKDPTEMYIILNKIKALLS